MSDSFFADLEINKPEYSLGVQGGLHGAQTGKMLGALEDVLLQETPDLIWSLSLETQTPPWQGRWLPPSFTCLWFTSKPDFVCFNKTMPEEINRVIADHTCDYLFAPTRTAMSNLEAENLSSKAFLTGDIMVDAHKAALEISRTASLNMAENDLEKNGYYLLTLHRPYNVDQPDNLSAILSELGGLSKKIIFPVHPRTRKIINENQLTIPSNIQAIKPVGYLDFVRLQANAVKIITDSGGIQKEAYILKKPCITLRSETEWVETVEAGWNLLINPLTEQDYSERIAAFEPPARYENVFGENVAEKMGGIINEMESPE